VRAARALLGWSGPDLATKAGVSLSTVRLVESGEAMVKHARITLIQALRNAGIELIPHDVRLIPA
jgi:transcriptional regulator with XRE-family HTH domain